VSNDSRELPKEWSASMGLRLTVTRSVSSVAKFGSTRKQKSLL